MKIKFLLVAAAMLATAGCQSTTDGKVHDLTEVSNAPKHRTVQVLSVVKTQALVGTKGKGHITDAVTLTYDYGGQKYSVTQVGKACNYKTGFAWVTGTESNRKIKMNKRCSNQSQDEFQRLRHQ